MSAKLATRPPPVVIALLVLLTISPLPASGKLPQKIELKGASFTLSATLSIKLNGALNGLYNLREYHSAWQWRSRIDFQQLAGGHTRGAYYADDNQAFQVDRVLRRCSRLEPKDINAVFKMEFAGQLEELPHVIGTVRLLHFIEEHSDAFERAASGGEFSAKIGKISVSVGYASDGSSSLPLGVPSKVVVTRPDGYELTLRTSRVALLPPMELVYGDTSLPASARQFTTAARGSDEPMFDVFAVDRNYGCSAYALASPEITKSLADTHQYRFTFSARVTAGLLESFPMPTTVGYEPELETLRVNQRFPGHSSQTWVSYRHDRIYNVISRNHGPAHLSLLDKVLDLSAGEPEIGESISCVVSKASLATHLAETCRTPHSLGAMLLGATKGVTYIGLARVRGIEAYAFEAYDSQLPVWLEHPTVYEEHNKPGGALQWRNSSQSDNPMKIKLNTVFYFSRTRTDHGSNRLLNNKLLLIEITKSSPLGFPMTSITIPVFEFNWGLQTVAPNGQRTEDFYSLGDECLAPPGEDNHYAHIGFDLRGTLPGLAATTDYGSSLDWLKVAVKRNLALMRAVNEQFGVPPTFVYDFESRNKQQASSTGLVVSATMQAAERQEAPVSLIYLGRGTPDLGHLQFRTFDVSGFQMCYQLVSHKRQDAVFAYSGRVCWVYGPELPEGFQTNPMSSYELFKIVHRPDRKLVHDDYITKLDEMQARLVSAGRAILTDPSESNRVPQQHDEEETRAKLYFKLTDVQVDQLNEKTAYDLDEHHLNDVNKFPGLGLLPDDPQNKLVAPKSEDSEAVAQQVAMTFEQCHEACLIDIECESFSTCIVQGRVQCVLSSVDFKVSTVVLQLMELRGLKSKLGEAFLVNLDGSAPVQQQVENSLGDLSNVHVKRHPTCELHNKLYRDLFKDVGKSFVTLRDRLLRPVTHSEQCAEFCYLGTLATMRKETRRLRKTLHGPEHDPGVTEGYSAGHCGHYYFLDKQTIASSGVQIPKEQIISMHTDGATRGYCLFDDGSSEPLAPSPRLRGQKTNAQQSFQLRKFELDFSVMYEKEYGISLAESKKLPGERTAYRKIYIEQDFSRDNLDVMRKFIEQGGNTGHKARVRSAQECARMCFKQLTPLWPACRSFEFYEVLEKSVARRHYFCTFNTATVQQLIELGRTDMVVRSAAASERVQMNDGDEMHVWHYEPRQGLVASSLRERYQVSLDETQWELDEHLKSMPSFHFSSLGLLFLIAVLFTAGTVGGAFLQSRNSTHASDDKEILIERSVDLNLEDVPAQDKIPQVNIENESFE